MYMCFKLAMLEISWWLRAIYIYTNMNLYTFGNVAYSNQHFNSNNVMCAQPVQRSAHFWYRNNFCRRAILDFATL